MSIMKFILNYAASPQRLNRLRVAIDGPRYASRYHPPSRLNRSRKWRSAPTYLEARALSPFPLRPVR
jgi:hypothetical protein